MANSRIYLQRRQTVANGSSTPLTLVTSNCRCARHARHQRHAFSTWQTTALKRSISAAASGEGMPTPRKRQDWSIGPNFELTKEDALDMQLEALKNNNYPFVDHGIEVLYRFSNFDPFSRSDYFGRTFDLGQFERFRRIFHSPYYSVLLGHTRHKVLSSLQVSERKWVQRVWVKGYRGTEEGTFVFTLVQRLGGRYDGYWFTESVLVDGQGDITVYLRNW